MTKKLNEVTKVTTMNENEYITIILGDDKIAKIKKGDLFPIANVEKPGLMSPKLASKMREYTLPTSTEIDSGFNHAGIIVVTSLTLTGSALVGISTTNSLYIHSLYPGGGGIVFENTPGKLCVYKKSASGTFFINNNTPSNLGITISLL